MLLLRKTCFVFPYPQVVIAAQRRVYTFDPPLNPRLDGNLSPATGLSTGMRMEKSQLVSFSFQLSAQPRPSERRVLPVLP
uniref:hypothetical protein n=1 Tax=Alistipes shahii TaxID=328814 RepID=UPI003FEED845